MKLLIGAISISKPKYAAIHEKAKEVFDEVIVNPFGRALTEEEILERWDGVDAIVAGTEKYTREMLEKAPSTLKVISKHGVGVDNIDLAAAKARGITVCNTPGANADAVAEATMGLILCVLRKIPVSDQYVRTNNWKRLEGHLIKGQTIGVIGMGNIGKNVILRAEPFGAKFMAYDPYFDSAFAQVHNVQQATIEEILKTADIVSLHLPCTPETYHMINQETLAMMKPGAALINTARGELIDEEALYQALKCGRLGGAGLDVYSSEPMYNSPLFELDNIVVTPHMAGNTSETTMSMGMWALDNAMKVITGQDGAVIVK